MELTPTLERQGFCGARRELFSFINLALHQNAYCYWVARIVSSFATEQGVSEEDSRRWLDELERADREGRFGFVYVGVLTTATLH